MHIFFKDNVMTNIKHNNITKELGSLAVIHPDLFVDFITIFT